MGSSFNISAQSLSTQRRLSDATSALSRSFEKLASGARINRASDDAAGLAISERLKTGARLYQTATRNINDGVSTLNIIDGALQEQSSILQRMLELAEQSANGSYSKAQRTTLQAEYQTLIKEFSRIGDSTQFNGLNLLRGYRTNGVGDITLQVGIDSSANARMSMTAKDTGSFSGTLVREQLSASVNGSIDILDYSWLTTGVGAGFDNYNTNRGQFTVTDSNGKTRTLEVFTSDYSVNGATTEVWFQIVEPLGNGTYAAPSSSAGWSGLFGMIVNFDTATGRGLPNQSTTLTFADSATAEFTLDVSGLTLNSAASGTNTTAIDLTSIGSMTTARSALNTVTNRLSELAKFRGELGASMSRLFTASSVSSSLALEYTAAGGRIRDVDIASESAQLTANQIKQNAAALVLQQVNQQPSLLLSLLY